MIYLATPKAILQNKGNLAMVSINFTICSLLTDPTLRSPPADPAPQALGGLGPARAQSSQPGTRAAPRGQTRLVGWGGGERRLGPGKPGEARHVFHESLVKERRGQKRQKEVGRTAFLAEGLLEHLLVHAEVVHPGPTTAWGEGLLSDGHLPFFSTWG